MSNGNDGGDEKFSAFMKRHRPEPPPASRSEKERVWLAIEAESEKRKGFFAWWQPAVAGSVFAVIVIGVIGLGNRPSGVESIDGAGESSFQAEAELIEESLGLEFMQNGEIYEVVELAELGD